MAKSQTHVKWKTQIEVILFFHLNKIFIKNKGYSIHFCMGIVYTYKICIAYINIHTLYIYTHSYTYDKYIYHINKDQ